MKSYSLVLDVGTTGVKALVFDSNLDVVVRVSKALGKQRPKQGWVEQDPRELVRASKSVLRKAVKDAGLSSRSYSGFGVTNQRETTILWSKKTGRPVYPAIVWEDARTKEFCSRLRGKYQGAVRRRTGLSLDPYFSASKISWILDTVSEARELLQKDELLFGTVDTWLLWNMLEGRTHVRPHVTDYTNASRTLLFNIETLKWDVGLLELFGVSRSMLPEVRSSAAHFGDLRKDVVGFSLPARAVCGDQQSSMYAAGTRKGVTKVTYGTGTFVMQMVGSEFTLQDGLFTTLVPGSKKPLYALEMKIGGTGQAVQKLLDKKKSLEPVLRTIAGDVCEILEQLPLRPKKLILDGGIVRDDKLAPLQSEASGLPVETQKVFDGTSLGIAKMLQ